MDSAGVARAVAGALLACLIVAQATGCGSGAGSGGSEPVPGPWVDTDRERPEPDVFDKALFWSVTPNMRAVVTGQLDSIGQVDIFDIGPVRTGDRVQVEVLGYDGLDPVVAVLDENEDLLIANDDRSYYGGLTDPLAQAIILHPSDRCYVAVAVSPRGTTAGAYTLEVLLTEGEPPDPPQPQRIYLNFDGAEAVRIGTRTPVSVPVFDAASIDQAFAGHTDEIVNNVLMMVQEDYYGLNVELYSSRDGPPPEEPCTTLHFGTFDANLLGVSENIDEYNLSASQEAIIFTDTFAAFSVLNPSVEQISQALANVASHEAGHLLGLYHCRDPHAIMDVTATLGQMLGDQTFGRARMHEEYFPIGYQNALQMLAENVGGDLVAARELAAVLRTKRSNWYEAASGPAARSSHIFSTCPHCLQAKARRYAKQLQAQQNSLSR